MWLLCLNDKSTILALQIYFAYWHCIILSNQATKLPCGKLKAENTFVWAT